MKSHTRRLETASTPADGVAVPTLRAAAVADPAQMHEPKAKRLSRSPVARLSPTPPAERSSLPGPPALEPSRAAPLHDEGSIIAGKYELVREIGNGGMGSVWLAHNLALDIDVALKLIRRDRTRPEAKRRLLQEARAAARIGHPSIVRIFDFGESDEGDPFIVMELLNGEPLSGVLSRKRRLAPDVAGRTLLPVASALVAAHAKGIVHRDLKPDNILLVTNEVGVVVPKVVDFGIARLLDSEIDGRFTVTGEVLGSPDYMSPEQARGEEDVGEPTDIWAFAVMLYEAVTGKRPFTGMNYNALLMHIINVDPAPTKQLGVEDEELWQIISRGLAKDIARRWPSMRDMGKALASWVMARGFNDDIAGTSLGKHWLSGGRRRTISVRPPAPVTPSIDTTEADTPLSSHAPATDPDPPIEHEPTLPALAVEPAPPRLSPGRTPTQLSPELAPPLLPHDLAPWLPPPGPPGAPAPLAAGAPAPPAAEAPAPQFGPAPQLFALDPAVQLAPLLPSDARTRDTLARRRPSPGRSRLYTALVLMLLASIGVVAWRSFDEPAAPRSTREAAPSRKGLLPGPAGGVVQELTARIPRIAPPPPPDSAAAPAPAPPAEPAASASAKPMATTKPAVGTPWQTRRRPHAPTPPPASRRNRL